MFVPAAAAMLSSIESESLACVVLLLDASLCYWSPLSVRHACLFIYFNGVSHHGTTAMMSNTLTSLPQLLAGGNAIASKPIVTF